LHHLIYLIIFFASLITIVIVKKLSILFSDKYFSIVSLLTSHFKYLNMRGTFILFSTPIIVSLALSLWLFDNQELYLYIFAYGFLTTFLTLWPILINPQKELSPAIYKYRFKLYFLYIIYFLLYELVCEATQITCTGKLNLYYSNFLGTYTKLDPFMQNVISNIFSTLFWVIIAGAVVLFSKRAKKWLSVQV